MVRSPLPAPGAAIVPVGRAAPAHQPAHTVNRNGVMHGVGTGTPSNPGTCATCHESTAPACSQCHDQPPAGTFGSSIR
jgi:hypothetical protein